MSLLRRLVTLPLAPIEGVIWVAEQLERQAADQLYGPSAVLQELQRLNAALDRGEISAEEHAEAESGLLDRFEIAMMREGGSVPHAF